MKHTCTHVHAHTTACIHTRTCMHANTDVHGVRRVAHTHRHTGAHTGACTDMATRACALCARTHAVHVFVARGHTCVRADMHVHIRTNTYTHSHTSCWLPATRCRWAQGAGCQPHARTLSGLPTPGPAHPVTLGDIQPTKSPDFPNSGLWLPRHPWKRGETGQEKPQMEPQCL